MYNCVFGTVKGAERMSGCEEIDCPYCVTYDEVSEVVPKWK